MRKKSKKKDLMIKRKVRLKKRRKRFLIASIAFLSFAIIFTSLIYKLYVNSKCKDLSYAINYTLTTKAEKNERLMDIQQSNLIFQDDDTAIVEASGFAKKKPHSNTTIKGYFKKTNFGVWQLSKTSLIPL
ncbi:MAG: hypothetical protein RR894_17645 [Terrisporobacter sp.]